MELDKVLNIDCMIGLQDLPSESVDLVVTDVPYLCTSRGGSGTMSGYWKSDTARKGTIFEHNSIKKEEYLPQLYRVLKDGTHCYIMCNNYNLIHFLKVIDDSEFHFTKSLIWNKGNAICGRYYMGMFEYILMLRKGKDRAVNDCGIGDILKVQNTKTKNKDGSNIHDSEKPIALFETLITQSTNEGDVVLDPFMGSGTTALACMNTKRHYVGYEIDEKYYNLIQNRIRNNHTQLKLF